MLNYYSDSQGYFIFKWNIADAPPHHSQSWEHTMSKSVKRIRYILLSIVQRGVPFWNGKSDIPCQYSKTTASILCIQMNVNHKGRMQILVHGLYADVKNCNDHHCEKEIL